MSQAEVDKSATAAAPVSEVVAGGFFAVIFGAAFLTALGFEGEAAIFPLGVSGLGTIMSLAYIGRAVWRSRTGGRAATTPQSPDDDQADADIEYVFATASAPAWARALAYFIGFFFALFLVGLYLTAPLFTIVYLRREGNRSWLFSISYAAVLLAALYLAFGVVLQLPVPAGLLSGG